MTRTATVRPAGGDTSAKPRRMRFAMAADMQKQRAAATTKFECEEREKKACERAVEALRRMNAGVAERQMYRWSLNGLRLGHVWRSVWRSRVTVYMERARALLPERRKKWALFTEDLGYLTKLGGVLQCVATPVLVLFSAQLGVYACLLLLLCVPIMALLFALALVIEWVVRSFTIIVTAEPFHVVKAMLCLNVYALMAHARIRKATCAVVEGDDASALSPRMIATSFEQNADEYAEYFVVAFRGEVWFQLVNTLVHMGFIYVCYFGDHIVPMEDTRANLLALGGLLICSVLLLLPGFIRVRTMPTPARMRDAIAQLDVFRVDVDGERVGLSQALADFVRGEAAQLGKSGGHLAKFSGVSLLSGDPARAALGSEAARPEAPRSTSLKSLEPDRPRVTSTLSPRQSRRTSVSPTSSSGTAWARASRPSSPSGRPTARPRTRSASTTCCARGPTPTRSGGRTAAATRWTPLKAATRPTAAQASPSAILSTTRMPSARPSSRSTCSACASTRPLRSR